MFYHCIASIKALNINYFSTEYKNCYKLVAIYMPLVLKISFIDGYHQATIVWSFSVHSAVFRNKVFQKFLKVLIFILKVFLTQYDCLISVSGLNPFQGLPPKPFLLRIRWPKRKLPSAINPSSKRLFKSRISSGNQQWPGKNSTPLPSESM